ncbi:MAG: DUF4153 domain-containing protein [Syntrophomonas sp.]|nr:DUF4153 domain-containing protein [Syntrophomonas sp.]
MQRIKELFLNTTKRLFEAVSRFPLTVICLVSASVLICYMISLDIEPDLAVQKLMFTFLLGSFLGVAAQFLCERFKRLQTVRMAVYGVSILIIAGYYLILMPATSISAEVAVRTLVAVFAMFCVFIWVPSYRSKVDFNAVTLTHFKSALISVLYSGVLSAGFASIIATIDILLFSVDDKAYAYMMTIIWVLFATIYYLSLLPRYNSEDKTQQAYARLAAQYPKFLQILISYIAIPLVATYTLVLAAYFIKILITLKWPSGQLGGMVLAYSAAGLIIYILASLIDNRFAKSYRLIFPKVLIPIVIMQLISVGIRLDAYGVTESRYYVALFGLFSLICAIALSFKPVSQNGIIALLAAGLAILSVLPPIDAFSVSKSSQINRIETILSAENILIDGKISPQADVSANLRLEATSILFYLQNRSYINDIDWLPADFSVYRDMEKTFGFKPSYDNNRGDINYFFANLDMRRPLSIGGYDIFFNANSYREVNQTSQSQLEFEVNKVKYTFSLERLSAQEVKVAIKNQEGTELVATGLFDFAQRLAEAGSSPKEARAPEDMSFDVEKDGYKLRILFQNINIIRGSENAGVDYSFFVIFGLPASAAK